MFQPLEIHVAILPLRQSRDRRPWVIVERVGSAKWRVLPISAALDLFNSDLHFRLNPEHPDFEATGLKKTSFIIANWPVDVMESTMQKRIGCLEGRLAAEFLEWLEQ